MYPAAATTRRGQPPRRNKYQIPNTKYTCNTGQTRNKLEQWVHPKDNKTTGESTALFVPTTLEMAGPTRQTTLHGRSQLEATLHFAADKYKYKYKIYL